MLTRDARSRPGLALIKALVLVLILATIVAIAVPGVALARKIAAEQATKHNLATVAKAVDAAHTVHKKLPPFFGPYGGADRPLTFHAHLLPYLGMKEVYDAEPINGQAIVPAFLSPMDPTQTNGGAGAANYPVNLRLFYTNGGAGILGTHGQKNLVQISWIHVINGDGMSNTLLFATKYQNCGATGGSMWLADNVSSPFSATFGSSVDLWQNAPTQAACNPTAGTAVSFRPDYIHTALCDGSVRTLSRQIDPFMWANAHTYAAYIRRPGELPIDWD